MLIDCIVSRNDRVGARLLVVLALALGTAPGRVVLTGAACFLECHLVLVALLSLALGTSAPETGRDFLLDLAILKQEADVGPPGDGLVPQANGDLVRGDDGAVSGAVERDAGSGVEGGVEWDPDADVGRVWAGRGVAGLCAVVGNGDRGEGEVARASRGAGDGARGLDEGVSLVRRLVNDEGGEVGGCGGEGGADRDWGRGGFPTGPETADSVCVQVGHLLELEPGFGRIGDDALEVG